ncbi:MAG: c-type cytochrome [Limisphaerales bacterium]
MKSLRHPNFWLSATTFVAALTLLSSLPARAAEGKGLFIRHCGSCHGADGKAKTPMGAKLKAKDLAESKLSDVDLDKLLQDGRRDEKGNLRMPAFKEKLTGEEIRSLITLAKTFRK